MILALQRTTRARIEAGVVYALNEATGEGHVYLPEGAADRDRHRASRSNPEEVRDAIDRAASQI